MEYELNFRDYLRILDKRKWVIVLTIVLSIVISIVSLNRQTSVYEAACTVRIVQRSPMYGTMMGGFDHGMAMASMETEANIIKSYAVLEKVCRRPEINLINEELVKEKGNLEKEKNKLLEKYTSEHPKVAEITDKIKDIQNKFDNIVNSLRSQVSTETIERTNMIKIAVTSSDPQAAMKLANIVASVYEETSLRDRSEEATTVREFIEKQLKTVENNLSAAENGLKDFRAQQGTVAEIAQPLQDKLVELEFEHAKLSQKFTDEHPKMIEIKEQISDIQKQLSSYSAESIRFSQLQRDVEVNRKLYGLLKERFEESRISEVSKIGNIKIVNPATLPTSPVSPDRQRTISLGAAFGLIFGLILSFMLENLDTSIGTIEDVENIVKLPVLSVVPRIIINKNGKIGFLKNLFSKNIKAKEDDPKVRLLVHFMPKSTEAEAYRALRTNLKIGEGRKVFTVTSAGPREGKTTVLINLGIATAQAGFKTLLISTDLRRPAIYKTFNINVEPGFYEIVTNAIPWRKAVRGISDFLIGNIEVDDAVKTRGLDNLYIITAGHMISNPSEILNSENIKFLVEDFRRNFDVVLFDSPPVLPLSDALLLSKYCDGVILVYEIGKTSRDALMRAKAQIEGYGSKIIGIVMNQIKPQMGLYSGYRYYYYSKYRYYSDEKDKPVKR